MIKKSIQFINYLFFLLFVGIIAIIPFRILYFVADFLAWLLRRVVKYRLAVVEDNLSQSDLTLTPNEKDKIIREIYRNLADVLMEGIKSFSMRRASIIKRHKVLNPELVNPYHARGDSLILVTGHIGNWEWGSLSAGIQTPYHILGFYKPLRNKFIDRFLRYSRSKFGTLLAPIRQTSLSFEKQKGTPTVFLMAADQNPSRVSRAIWQNFLGRPTAFLHGPEKHAVKNNYPVIFAEINRVKRGMYELTLSVLVENPMECVPGEITSLYAAKLEKYIRQNPSSWLWTHKRWKHKPPKESISVKRSLDTSYRPNLCRSFQ